MKGNADQPQAAMLSATFRFHDELNDFLPPERRCCEFTVPCARVASVKHMIEALGVPHTEVGAVLVNGAAAGLERPLTAGDRVEVRPANAPPESGSLEAPRFVADSHLGALAKLLRMAGFDTLYCNIYADREIAAIAVNEDRILLSRDRELLKYHEISHGCYVHAQKPNLQFREIIDRLALGRSARPFTRCLECNAPLREIDKSAVLDRLPPSVKMLRNRFWTCAVCGRVFWEGTHWRRMKERVDEALRKAI